MEEYFGQMDKGLHVLVYRGKLSSSLAITVNMGSVLEKPVAGGEEPSVYTPAYLLATTKQRRQKWDGLQLPNAIPGHSEPETAHCLTSFMFEIFLTFLLT